MIKGDPEDSLISFVASEFGMHLMHNHVHQFETLLAQSIILCNCILHVNMYVSTPIPKVVMDLLPIHPTIVSVATCLRRSMQLKL
jgi:hypothetical protein